MRVLVGCEYSGRVRDAFIARGHDALSCDLLPTDAPGPHYQGSVFDVLEWDWDLAIFHPPCTYLTNAGVRWLYQYDSKLKQTVVDSDGNKVRNEDRWENMREGAEFFKALLECSIPKIAVENPVMHKYARDIVGRGPDQIVQPWMFGHMETKATGLWLKGLDPLVETDNVKDDMMKLSVKERSRIHYLPPSADRWKIRSTTFQGIADAMASQWG